MFFFDPTYLLFILPGVGLSLWGELPDQVGLPHLLEGAVCAPVHRRPGRPPDA